MGKGRVGRKRWKDKRAVEKVRLEDPSNRETKGNKTGMLEDKAGHGNI